MFFGSLTGQLVVMDVHGAMVSNVTLLDAVPVLEMGWNCEKFKMEERDETTACPGKSKHFFRIMFIACAMVNNHLTFKRTAFFRATQSKHETEYCA